MEKNSDEIKQLFLERASDDGSVRVFIYKYGDPAQCEEILEKTVYVKNISEDGKSFNFYFGFPGPDYNTYFFSDFGKTWALTLEDFEFDVKKMHQKTSWGVEYDYYVRV